MFRAVFDTNIIVSSVLSQHGNPAQAIAAWREQRFLLFTSPALIAEVRHTLGYDRIRRRYNLTDALIDDIIALLVNDAIVVSGTADVWGTIAADPDDDHVLACAVEAEVDVIVSGDRHLPELGHFRDIPILTVRDFLARLAAQ